ncbi:MAG: glutamate racemase [Sphingobacteriales bacterium]|jgi:glutamate racemase|nr:glutamate racemase [Sphingobacteriales bacterium]MBP7555754.1 glutamate racemase [Chitinophagaceae bacterium]NCT74449.1 glutamate racemase [Chitinophagaceae bacterium]OJW32503.1 MAG: glutamate racemase [Sphingobacteriales bacterium 46-32]
MSAKSPIGVFDSGYGGLTVLKEIVARLPQYDYLYLGDNARAPYGNRSFETVYQYTLQCVEWFFEQGCSLVILACNTASAKALRTIQQKDLPRLAPHKRVLGVIRPTTEVIGNYSESRQVGILATVGTVASLSYPVEIGKFFPDIKVYQEACPMWVPLIENNEQDSHGADYFVKKNLHQLLEKGPLIDVALLACTHYPLMKEKIREHLPVPVKLLSQGEIVATSLADYLQRHPEIEQACSREGKRHFYTTDSTEDFDNHATRFFGEAVQSSHLDLS